MEGNKTVDMVTKWLVLIGGLNWGLTGIGGFVKMNLNVVNMLLGKIPQAEWAVYILVGLSALYMLMGMFKKQ